MEFSVCVCVVEAYPLSLNIDQLSNVFHQGLITEGLSDKAFANII